MMGHPSAPAPSIQYHASNLDWQFISYMIVYMFQCHSPKSSHPLPHVQKTVLYICVSLAVSHTRLSLPSFWIPYICVSILYWCLMKVKEESEKAGLKQHSKNEDHGIRSHHFMGNRWRNSGNSVRLYFLGAPLQMVTAAMKLKDAYSLEEKLWPA